MGTFDRGKIAHSTPIRNQMWPLKVEWLSDTVICIAFFSCIKYVASYHLWKSRNLNDHRAFDVEDAIQELWAIQAPVSTEM
jgi:hypothetical protein